jgi:hypothetical protein
METGLELSERDRLSTAVSRADKGLPTISLSIFKPFTNSRFDTCERLSGAVVERLPLLLKFQAKKDSSEK